MDWGSYISGFFDGDGSISIEKFKNGGYTVRVKLFQSNLAYIDALHSKYPFLHKSTQTRKRPGRIEYSLRASGYKILPLLKELESGTILKYEQVLLCIKFLNTNPSDCEKEEIYNQLKQLKKESNIKPYERLSIPYLCGFFDAEGSIGLYTRGLRVKVTQKSDFTILKHIANMYNNTNRIDNYAVCFYGQNCKSILEDLGTKCIYKLPQIKVALNYLNGNIDFMEAASLLKNIKKEN
jgi:hypothetical protein